MCSPTWAAAKIVGKNYITWLELKHRTHRSDSPTSGAFPSFPLQKKHFTYWASKLTGCLRLGGCVTLQTAMSRMSSGQFLLNPNVMHFIKTFFSHTVKKSYSSSSEVICQSERIQFRLDQHHGCDKIKLKLMTMVQSTGKKQNFFLILKGPPFPSGVGKLKSRNKFKTEIHLMWGYQGSARTLAAIKAELRYNKARTSYLRTSNSK